MAERKEPKDMEEGHRPARDDGRGNRTEPPDDDGDECPDCGAELEGDGTCSECGYERELNEHREPPRSEVREDKEHTRKGTDMSEQTGQPITLETLMEVIQDAVSVELEPVVKALEVQKAENAALKRQIEGLQKSITDLSGEGSLLQKSLAASEEVKGYLDEISRGPAATNGGAPSGAQPLRKGNRISVLRVGEDDPVEGQVDTQKASQILGKAVSLNLIPYAEYSAACEGRFPTPERLEEIEKKLEKVA